MKVLFAVSLLLLPLLAMGEEVENDTVISDISEKRSCYVPGQCQEYSVNFKRTNDVDLCHKFCGTNEDCSWWSFEPSQNLCVLFTNCTESGAPDVVACEDCISGEKLCPARECHGAFKCRGIFIDSFDMDYLEDCLKACSDNDECMWFTLEKTHNHCILYEGCENTMPCDTCASGERTCSVGYHGPTKLTTTAPPTQAPTTVPPTKENLIELSAVILEPTQAPEQGYGLVTSGRDCNWITSEDECREATAEVNYSTLDQDDLPRGCLTMIFSGMRMSAFNTYNTDVECGMSYGGSTVDCVCKGKGMTALPKVNDRR